MWKATLVGAIALATIGSISVSTRGIGFNTAAAQDIVAIGKRMRLGRRMADQREKKQKDKQTFHGEKAVIRRLNFRSASAG